MSEPKWRSQMGQDRWVWDRLGGKADGRFVEVGALDGLKFSNTKALEDIGWTGVLIEPVAANFERVLANRPKAECVRCAIDYHEGQGEIQVPAGEHFATFPGVATMERLERERWPCQWRRETVATAPLSELVQNVSECHYLSIDIEGRDMVALETWEWERLRPWVITIEYGRAEGEISQFLGGKNYRLEYRDHQDLYWVAGELPQR